MNNTLNRILSFIPDATKLAIAIATAVGEAKGFIRAHAFGREKAALVASLTKLVNEADPISKNLHFSHPLRTAVAEARELLEDLGVTIVDIDIPPRPTGPVVVS